jgi:hypothetical protein
MQRPERRKATYWCCNTNAWPNGTELGVSPSHVLPASSVHLRLFSVTFVRGTEFGPNGLVPLGRLA